MTLALFAKGTQPGYCVRCHTGYAVGPHRCSLLKRINGWLRLKGWL